MGYYFSKIHIHCFNVTHNVVATSKNQVYHLHRRMLDPRRPMQKPNAEEQEEMLVQYDAVLPPDPRRAITHKNQVSTNHICSAFCGAHLSYVRYLVSDIF